MCVWVRMTRFVAHTVGVKPDMTVVSVDAWEAAELGSGRSRLFSAPGWAIAYYFRIMHGTLPV